MTALAVIAHVGGAAGYLYLAPVLIVIGMLAVQNIRDRRRGGGDDADDISTDEAINPDEGHQP